MVWKLIILKLALSLLSFKSKNNHLDPGRIYWPRTEWVVYPISFSSNHAGDTVSMTVYFTISSSLSDGFIELGFPSGFTLTSSEYYQSSSSLLIPISSLLPNSTTSIVLSNIQLPLSKGSYGPFAIYTRQYSTGQIIDMNENFCSIGIVSAHLPPPSDSLTIVFADYNMDTVSAKSSLMFTFVLTEDLWVYDTFVISVPSYFTLLNPVCVSETVSENLNYFDTIGTGLHTFGCFFDSTEGNLYIYGLSVNIDISKLSQIGSLTVSFLVTGFTNPNANYDTSLYSWTLTIYRFGTSTIIQSFTGTGPDTSPGVLSVNYWQPYNTFKANNIISGLTLFMQLSFTADHLIPSTGSFVINFAGVDLTTNSWKTDKNQGITGGLSGYYLIEPYIGGTCNVLQTSISCSGFASAIQARNSVSLTLLVLFTSTSASIESLTTYLDTTTIIDYALNPLSITYASSVVLASQYTLLFSSSLNTAIANRVCNTGGGNYYIGLYLSLPVAVLNTNSINIILPSSTTSSNDFTINTGNVLAGKMIQQGSLQMDLTAGSSLSGITVSTGQISFNAAVSINNYLSAVFFIDNGSGSPSQMNLPYVSSNLWTRYESRIEIVISNVLYTFSSPITILPDSPGVTFDLLCSDSNRPGLPARITGNMNFGYSSIYYLYISIQFTGTIASDLGSGLTSGEFYPFSVDSLSAIPKSATMTLTTGAFPILTISGITSVLSTSLLTAYFPIGSLPVGSIKGTVSLYYIKKDRNDIQYIIFSSASTRIVSSNVANWQKANPTLSTFPIGTPLTQSSAGGYSLTLRPATTAGSTLGYVGLILPTGFTISSGTITDGVNSLSNPLFFTSSDINFAFPGLFAQETSSLSLSTSADTVLSFLGITTVGYFNSASPQVNLYPFQAKSSWNSACRSITGTTPTITLTKGVLSPVFSPSTVIGRGPGSLQSTINITITTVNPVPSGGYIEFSLNSNWATTANTQFSVMGLALYTFSNSVPYKISNFGYLPALSKLTISITNLLPPSNTGGTTTNSGHISYINTYAKTSTQLIDSWIDITDSLVPDSSIQVSPQQPTGSPQYWESSCFPNTASTDRVSVYLSFTLPNTLPSFSVISIKSPTSSWAITGDIKNSCWLSIIYQSCIVSGNQILITLFSAYNGGIIYFLGDKILDTPNVSVQDLYFVISSSFSSVAVDQTNGSPVNSSLNLVSPPSSVINLGSPSLVVNPNNAGESASYSFLFSVSVATVVGDQIWINFPDTFDAFIGNAQVLYTRGEPNNYYMSCSSKALGDIDCYADHWFIVVTNMNTLSAGTVIDITIDQVTNPASVSQIPNFQVYLVSSSFSIKAMNLDYPGVLIQSTTNSNIQIRTIQANNHYLQQSADYSFTVYLDSITFTAGNSLIIQFPYQFMLDRETASTSIICESLYLDESQTSSSYTVWDKGLVCSYIGYNQISLNISALGSWTITDRINVTLFNIPSPEWGFSRSEAEAVDNTYFTIYEEWTNKFEVFAFDNSSFEYIGRSFGNLNAGYVGFNHAGMVFTIDSYDPKYPEIRILLVPGTQSLSIPITITQRSGLQARKVVFNPLNDPKNNILLEFSSAVDSFFVKEGQQTIYFRVTTSITSANQLAYIDWTIDEYSLIGLTTDAYESPPKTLIEVYSLQLYSLTIHQTIKVPMNSVTTPIQITAEAPPNTNFTLSLSFADPTLNGIQINPTALTFTKEFTNYYFEISVTSSFTGVIGKEYEIQFGISGEDANVFLVPTASFTVVNSQTQSAAGLVFEFQSITENSVNVYVTSLITTQIYWQFSAAGTSFYSYEEIGNMVKPLINPSSSNNLSLKDQITNFHLYQEYEPLVNETWNDFQQRLYKASLSKIWYDVAYLQSNVKTLLLSANWLWGNTKYNISAFAYSEPLRLYNSTFSTLPLPLAIKLSLLFNDIVIESKQDTLTTIVAYTLGVPIKQLFPQIVQGRRLTTTTTFSWILTINRGSTISPTAFYNQLNQNSLKSKVFESGITNTIISFIGSEIPLNSYQSPYWSNTGYPAFYNSTNSSIQVSLKSAVDGSMCCIAEENFTSSSTVLPVQVFLLLGRNNLPVPGVCISNYAVDFKQTVIQINGLQSDSFYNVTCAAFNTYPLWPTSTAYSLSNPLPSFSCKTAVTVDVIINVSSGNVLLIFIILLIV